MNTARPGTSLVETLVAARVRGGAHASIALAAAVAALERLETRPFDDVVDPSAPAAIVGAGPVAGLPPGGRLDVRVEPVRGSESGRAGAVRIEVCVSWREGSRPRRVLVATLRG